MNRTPILVGVLALVALALLIVACGSDPMPTSVPAATTTPTSAPGVTTPSQPRATTAAPAAAPTKAPTPTPTLESPPAAPTPTPEEPEETDPSDGYFAMDRVLEVSIEVNPEDWDTLRHQTRTFEDLMAEIEKYQLSRPFASIYDWFSATVTIDGETHTEVGVRKKGFLGSQSDSKPSLKLRYDKYVDGQSLGGVMERMTLNNSIQDPSMVNTCLAYQVFAAAGNPAPRCNFATVTVNGKELGLYVHVEEIKAPMLARHFDSAEGNLYEGTVSDFTPEYRGTIEKKTNEDADDWSDVDGVVAALLDTSDAGLKALGELVDLGRFLSFWATESLVGHWDGYTGDRNNYHFYREPEGKFVFIPWGVDDVFHLKDDPNPFDNISEPPPSVLALTAIPNRLYNIPEWGAKYAERLKEILDTVWDEDELLSSVDRMAAIVQEHSLPDAKDEAAEDTERVRKFILTRKGEILADITPEPPDWPEPEGPDAPAGSITPEAWEIHFETVWGSSKNPNPFEEGEVTYLNIDADPPDAMAVIAGEAGAEEQTILPGIEDSVSISILSLESSGSIAGITLVLPADKLTGGVTLALGKDAIGGVVWTIPPGSVEPNWFLPLSGARLELVEASGKPGAVISGRFYGSIGGAPVPGEEGAGTVATAQPGGGEPEDFELLFETTWGSNTSADPFAEGTLTYAGEGPDDTPGMVAVIAGEASPEERAILPGVSDMASISIFGLGEDGSIAGVTIVLPQKELTSSAVLVLGEDVIAGGVWEIPSGASAPAWFIPLDSGQLELTGAGTEPGTVISGRLFGSFEDASSSGGGEGETVAAPVAAPVDIGLVINEVAAKGEPLDWFELYNTLDDPIGLFAFLVADDLDDPSKRVAFPPGTEIQPGEYLRFEVDTDNWAGFKLGSDEELGIWLQDGTLVAMVDWDEGDSGEGESYARAPDGNGEFQTVGNPTPGAANHVGN